LEQTMEIAGIDAGQIVASLMQIEERPLLLLESRKEAAATAVSAIARVKNGVESFRLAATRLSSVSSFDRYKTSVSQPDAVVASVSGAAFNSSISFSVDQLARAHGRRSLSTVASDSIPVTNDSAIAIAAGTLGIGVNTIRAGVGLAAGTVQFDVTQSSAGGSSVGSSPLASSTVVSAASDAIAVDVNGTAFNIKIAAGTYDQQGLTQAVQDALDASGAAATASLDSTGALSLTTIREGSSASLQITGGTALASVGLGVDALAHVGTDGIVDIGGTITTVTQAEAGQAVAADTGAGTLDVVLSGGLRVGSTSIAVVSTGDRSLASVAAAINTAGGGISAAAVKVSAGAWRLQLNATATGKVGHIAFDGSVLTGIGGLVESSAAQNAVIRIGEGAGAYDVEASGNTFTNVISGVTFTVQALTTTPVTVGVERNDSAVADDVANLVSNANSLLAELRVQTRHDVTAGTKGALAGNGVIRRLTQQIRDSLGGQVEGVSSALPSTAGIQLTRDGSFTFDKATFLTAVADDPALISRLFGQGGTDTGNAVFASADANTLHGDYVVEVATAATRATSAVMFAGGALVSRIGVRAGSVTATYDVTFGQSTDQIIEGLNEAIAGAGLDVIVEADGTGLSLRAERWGKAGDFELNANVLGAGVWAAHSGTDVAGTIDGIAATGIGRRLSLNALVDSNAAGLQIDIEGGVSGSLGAVEYRPGIAARIVEVATLMMKAENGSLTSATTFAQRRVTDFGDQITRLEDRLAMRETNLLRQWSNLQTLLGGLENQNTYIRGQLEGLTNNWL
jgi:flagellar hook-associated protein 2